MVRTHLPCQCQSVLPALCATAPSNRFGPFIAAQRVHSNLQKCIWQGLRLTQGLLSANVTLLHPSSPPPVLGERPASTAGSSVPPCLCIHRNPSSGVNIQVVAPCQLSINHCRTRNQHIKLWFKTQKPILLSAISSATTVPR